MGKHKEWRKVAKKERRRKLRTQKAKEIDDYHRIGNCNEHEDWLKEQESMEQFEYEEIEKMNAEENRKWLQAEAVALEQWNKLQQKKEWLLQKQRQLEEKLRLEWELEQKRKKEEGERLKLIEEENKKRQEMFMKHLQDFLSGDSEDAPPELLISHETRPETEPCPFFTKTATCRFGDQCSRNHQYPGISKVLLATNFYIHFGLSNANYNEYDTDLMLEYEDNDTYKEFKDFFYDVLPEFEKFGRIVQFKVCNNHEKHLRGNTYIEFAELRCAVAAYRSLHTRWYGGRQVSLQFCTIKSWKNAICGLQSRGRCPKGRGCNFLHVFRNPNNLFNHYDTIRDSQRMAHTPLRSWRWSESPEREISRSSEKDRKSRRDSRDYTQKKPKSRHSSRRESSERRRRNEKTKK